MYDLQHGSTELAIQQQCIAQKREFPAHIKDSPEIEYWDEFYYNAFWELLTSKNESGGIPWNVIKSYAEHHELDYEMTEILIAVIRRMNVAFLQHLNKKA